MPETIVIDHRFCGPPRSANGGYAAGIVGTRVTPGGQVAATAALRRPPPLDTPLTVTRSGDRVVLSDREETLIASAEPGTLDLKLPHPPSEAAATDAAARYAGRHDHFFPTCFVCGPGRVAGDGLHVFAGPLDRTVEAGLPPGMVASPWTPDATLAAKDGLVDAVFLWAVLDCPGYFAIPQPAKGRLYAVLGTMTARIERRPAPGEALRVAGWPIGADGRKHVVGTAVWDATGHAIAWAQSVWVELKDPAAFHAVIDAG